MTELLNSFLMLRPCVTIYTMMFRCKAEISSWTSEVLKQVEEVREKLMEEVEQVHAEAEVRMADVSYVVNGIYTGKSAYNLSEETYL